MPFHLLCLLLSMLLLGCPTEESNTTPDTSNNTTTDTQSTTDIPTDSASNTDSNTSNDDTQTTADSTTDSSTTTDTESDTGGGCEIPDGAMTEIGQECCGGQCMPSQICGCLGDQWGCYHTDFCFGFMLPEGQCRSGGDCDNLQMCQGPADSNCGTCQNPPTCQDDNECGLGQVCSSTQGPSCLCSPGQPICAAACSTDADCTPGLSCHGSGHCVEITCTTADDCPDLFACTEGGTCARQTCTEDRDCPRSSPCVKGLCYSTYGTCSFPAP